MRDFLPKKFLSLALAAALAQPALAAPQKKNTSGASAPAATNQPLNQRDLQLLSRQVNDRGSDESLKNSAVFAMQALMDLNATKLPSAMKNGYQAYGKYRNSENLDRLKDLNALNVNSLASIGAETVTLPTKTQTSFRRLDPSFLTQGEAGKVAAEFERQSGMKRTDFLTAMADVSEKKISRSDPQMIDKAFARLEGFIDKIPNKEFRKNLEKNLHVVPETMRRGIVAQAVTKLAGFFADAGPMGTLPIALNESTVTEKPAATAASAAPSPASAPVAAAKEERKPSGADTALGELGQRKPLSPAEKKLRDGKNALAGVVLSAIQVQGQEPAATAEPTEELAAEPALSEPTIFEQVTKRYRLLTPSILPPQF
jgi:hypothetical protein